MKGELAAGSARHAAVGTVLVVDDEESFHRVIAPQLQRFRVIHAYNGWQARDELSRQTVDVALVDLNLPDTTGLALLGEFGREHPSVPVIVITAHDSPLIADWAKKGGAFEFLDKSLENYVSLGDVIDQALRARRPPGVELAPKEQWLRRVATLIVGILELSRRGWGGCSGELQRLVVLLHEAMQEGEANRRFASTDSEPYASLLDDLRECLIQLASSRSQSGEDAARLLGLTYRGFRRLVANRDL